jgi:hypothetical protein
MADPLDVIRAKRAEYESELARFEEQRMGFVGAIAACDDILNALAEGKANENQNAD